MKLTMLKKLFGLACVACLTAALAGCAGGDAPAGDNASGDATPTQQEQKADKPDKTDKAEKPAKQDKDADALAQGMTCKYISSYFATFGEALEQANQNGGGTVTLLADAPLSADGSVPKVGFRTTITVKSAGDQPFKIVRSAADAGPMLQITDGFVTLSNVVLDGSGVAGAGPIALVSDLGRLTLGAGAVLTGNESAAGASAVQVVGADAYLTLESGCEISGNTAADGASAAIVSEGGNIVNDGATFSGNTGGANANFLETAAGTFEGSEIAA